jgi:2-methylisocitrate lyase-like PEP mutase family enzyme
MMLDIAAKRADFRALHNQGYFLLPTAWDIGGAKRLEALGYAGFATTNTSLAWKIGRDARDLTRDEVLEHMRQLVNATEIAVNGDFGFGFATDTAELIDNVHMAIDTGVAALSISDRVGKELDRLPQAVARIQVCRHAIDTSGADIVLVARTKGLLAGAASVSSAIERLVALSAAGADVLCLPGLADPAAIRAVVSAVAPKSLDVPLMKPGQTTIELGELGVRRISVGDTFADAVWTSFDRVAEEFIDHGDLAPECCPVKNGPAQ